MATQYIMKATHINSAPFGFVHWVVTGSPDLTGDQSGYNPADLVGIIVDYISTYPIPTTSGSLGIPISGTPAPGAVIRATSPSTASWGQVDLNDTDAITGVLPDSNQGAQTLVGDVSGTTSAVSVNKIKGHTVTSQSLGVSQDGYVLTWDNADGYWKAKIVVAGSITGNPVAPQSLSTPQDGYALIWDSVDGYWKASPISAASIKGNTVASQFLGSVQDGYTLTWDNVDGYWKASPTNASSIKGNPVAPQSLGTLQDGYTLTWDNIDGYWKASKTDAKSITGHTVATQSLGVLQDGYTLTWDNVDGYWRASTTDAKSITGHAVATQSLGAAQDGYALTWDNADGHWKAKPESAITSAAAASTNGLRLTLTSGVPVTISDVENATTIYWTPYKSGDISLYTASTWTSYRVSELSLALGTLPNAQGFVYDIFAYYNGSAVVLYRGAEWVGTTTRTDALARQDGVLVLSSDHSKRYLGTFYAPSITTTADTVKKRLLWNVDNQVIRPMSVYETTIEWTTSGSYQQVRGSIANQVIYVSGDVDDATYVEAYALAIAYFSYADQGTTVSSGVGIDNAFVNSAQTGGGTSGWVTTTTGQPGAHLSYPSTYVGYPGKGFHTLVWLELGSAFNFSFYGSDTAQHKSGMQVKIFG